MPPRNKEGMVFLVGAGPGDPGLITVRGQQCLRDADVVLFDYLVDPLAVRRSAPKALRISLGKHGAGGRLWSQEEIHAALAEHFAAGRRIVRLKGGDPAIFARLAEEVDFLESRGIPFEIVPGITAALAVSATVGIPLTHRAHASAVALVTGHEDPNRAVPHLDFASLAKFPGTLVVYMGVTSACHWVGDLIAHGMSADTPVALIRRCSFPDQATVRCSLGDVPSRLTPYRKFPPPVIAVVGPVVDAPLQQRKAHREASPLRGVWVLNTRPLEESAELEARLAAAGAWTIPHPAIEIRDPREWSRVDDALRDLSAFDWLVFSSPRGVDSLLRRMEVLGMDARRMAGLRIAAVGPGTAARLRAHSLMADLIPAEHVAEGLSAALLEFVTTVPSPIHGGCAPSTPLRCLLPRGNRGRDILPESLRAGGLSVTEIVTYESHDILDADAEVLAMMSAGRITWTTVTSSAIARSLVAAFAEALTHTRLASLSPVTSGTLRELGFPPAAEAAQATIASLVDAMLHARDG